MTAPTKNWTSVPDTALDSDSPIDEIARIAARDNDEHLRQWLGGSFTPVQNHNHDGVNSALIEVGPNYLRNGNFESGTTGWTLTPYTGGTTATGTSNEVDGTTGLVITSTVAANGGGKAESGFMPVSGGQIRQFMMVIKASGATVPIKAEALWYDDTQASISATTIISVTASPTSNRLVVRRLTAPATARYCKVRLELPTGAGGTGSIYFDDVFVGVPAMLGGEQVFTASGTFSAVWGDVEAEVQGGGGGGSSGGWGGAGGYSRGQFTTSADVTVTVGGAGSGAGNGGSSSFGAFATGGGGLTGNSGARTGGTGSGGTVNIAGGTGHAASGTGSRGGDSFLGRSAVYDTGSSGTGYGAGGCMTSAASVAGTGGIVIVRW